MDTKQRLVEISKGIYVEGDVQRIAEKINEYDSNLFIQYSDPALSDIHDAPYRLMEHCKDGIDRVVFYIWELDDRVLERVRAADSLKGLVLQSLDQQNLTARNDMIRRYQDRVEADADIIRHVLASHKNTYTFKNNRDELVKVSDVRPVEKVKKED